MRAVGVGVADDFDDVEVALDGDGGEVDSGFSCDIEGSVLSLACIVASVCDQEVMFFVEGERGDVFEVDCFDAG